MQRVLITGGTGVLGRELVRRLVARGYTVRVSSRRPPAEAQPASEWAQADLETGAGLAEAVAGVQVILHCASSPFRRTRQVDVEGTQRLVQAARAAGVQHFVYISIVGVNRIPFAYYQHKLAAERIVESAGAPFTILRATQFHTLLDGWLTAANRLPLLFLPTDLRFQLVDAGEVADRLCEMVAAGPVGRAPDMGGPEILTLGEIARAWLEARGLRKPVISVPPLGGFAAALRGGLNTCPENRQGRITWAAWLEQTYGRREVQHAI